MRILYVLHAFPPEAWGGTELHVRALARVLAKNHEIRIFCRSGDARRPHGHIARSVDQGLKITRFNNLFADAVSFESIYKNEAAHRAFEAEIDDFSPDVVHFQHFTMLSITMVHACRLRRIPVVFSSHDFWTICPRGQRLTADLKLCERIDRNKCYTCLSSIWPQWLGNRLLEPTVRGIHGDLVPEVMAKFDREMAATFDLCDVIVSPSNFHRERMLEYGLKKDRVVAIPHGLDHSSFNYQRNPRDPVRVIGYIGTVIPTKGVHVLIEAFRLLKEPGLELHIHGDTPSFHEKKSYLYELKSLAMGIPDPVRFLGHYDHDQVARILSTIDILVVPSLWWETFCLTIREAMVAGVPVVASDIGAMREAVETHRSGLCFRTGDATDLARVISRLVRDSNLRASLAGRRNDVKSIEINAEDYLDVYNRAKNSAQQRREDAKVTVPSFPKEAAPETALQKSAPQLPAAPAAESGVAGGDVRLSIEKSGAGEVRVSTAVERGPQTRVSFVIGYGGGTETGEVRFVVDFTQGTAAAAPAARIEAAPARPIAVEPRTPSLPVPTSVTAGEAAAEIAAAEAQLPIADDRERERAMYMMNESKFKSHVKNFDDMVARANLAEEDQVIRTKKSPAAPPAATGRVVVPPVGQPAARAPEAPNPDVRRRAEEPRRDAPKAKSAEPAAPAAAPRRDTAAREPAPRADRDTSLPPMDRPRSPRREYAEEQEPRDTRRRAPIENSDENPVTDSRGRRPLDARREPDVRRDSDVRHESEVRREPEPRRDEPRRDADPSAPPRRFRSEFLPEDDGGRSRRGRLRRDYASDDESASEAAPRPPAAEREESPRAVAPRDNPPFRDAAPNRPAAPREAQPPRPAAPAPRAESPAPAAPAPAPSRDFVDSLPPRRPRPERPADAPLDPILDRPVYRRPERTDPRPEPIAERPIEQPAPRSMPRAHESAPVDQPRSGRADPAPVARPEPVKEKSGPDIDVVWSSSPKGYTHAEPAAEAAQGETPAPKQKAANYRVAPPPTVKPVAPGSFAEGIGE